MPETQFNFIVSAFLPPIDLTCCFNTTIYTVIARQLAKSCHLNLLELFWTQCEDCHQYWARKRKQPGITLFCCCHCISTKLYFVRISPCTTLGTRGFFLCATRSSVGHRPTCLRLRLWEKNLWRRVPWFTVLDGPWPCL